MRDPTRDVSRRTLLIIDEFGYVTQVQAVAAMAAAIAKVARKYGIALMVIDQNPHTFLDDPAGQKIWENTRMKILFHLDDAPARKVGEVLGDLAPQHVAWLPKAAKGECLMVIDNDVFVALIETNPRETRAFQGS
jgi:type IV secretory pathway TraG/TraD family ATPase VirD4